MARKAPTKAEREHMGKVADLGCILCRRLGLGKSPAEVHHVREGTGGGRRAAHTDTIPLCYPHHRGDDGIHGLGTKGFARAYDVTERELLAEVAQLLSPH